MLGCLAWAIPGDSMNTIWAGQWSGSEYMPLEWSNTPAAQAWAWTGGVNRCGDYCTAWGCGVNNTQHWSQGECGPASAP